MLRRDEVRELLFGYGLLNARVVGWAGAGMDLPGAVEIEVDGATVYGSDGRRLATD